MFGDGRVCGPGWLLGTDVCLLSGGPIPNNMSSNNKAYFNAPAYYNAIAYLCNDDLKLLVTTNEQTTFVQSEGSAMLKVCIK